MLEKLLQNNTAVRVFAFLLALILWLYVAGDAQEHYTTDTRRTFHDVSLAWINLEEDLVVKEVPEAVTITLEGSPEQFEGLSPANLEAYIDLEEKGEGEHQVAVEGSSPTGLTIVRFDPPLVKVVLELLHARQMEVHLDIDGSPAVGKEVGEPLLEPQEVFVQGIKERVSHVSRVGASVELEGEEQDLVAKFPLRAYDQRGRVVRGITLNPRHVRVHIPITVSNEGDSS